MFRATRDAWRAQRPRTAIGPLRSFALCSFARDRSAGLRPSNARARFAGRGGRPGPAFSGPRSRGTGRAARGLRAPHRPGTHRAWSPRMGPAPAGPSHPPGEGRAAAAVRFVVASRHSSSAPACPAAWWWRLRAQAPFAVTMPAGRLAGEECAAGGQPGRCPASVGRRTQAPPPRCRRGLGTRTSGGNGQMWTTAPGRKPTVKEWLSLQCPDRACAASACCSASTEPR
jgi:hypothetical protein